MAITNPTNGSAVASVTTSLALVAPTVIVDDIMLAHIYTNDNTAVVAPKDWALIREDNNTSTMRTSMYWKRASGSDSASTNTFTIAGTTLGYGIITVWRGASKIGNPFGNNTFSANASSDTVTYATLTPQGAYGAIIAYGAYSDDQTTAGAIAGTDPALANVIDVETATGNQASIFIYFGASSGIATGARSHATTSTVDGVNSGYLLEILPDMGPGGSSGGDGSAAYPRISRTLHTRARQR